MHETIILTQMHENHVVYGHKQFTWVEMSIKSKIWTQHPHFLNWSTVLCMQITKKFILFPFRDKTEISWVVASLIYSLQPQLTSIKVVLLIFCSMQLDYRKDYSELPLIS